MTLREQRHNLLIELVLLFAIGYNFLLAVVNAKVFRVSPAMTYVVEVAIYGACFLIGLWSLDRKRTAMVFTGIGLLAVLMLVRLFLVWSIDPKFFRDALIPFAFLVLGAAYTGSLPKLFLRMALVVSLVAAFELALPNVYGDVVNPKSYFVNARGASASSFWNQDSNLFVSATRPGARNFLPSSNLPRASSVFIEPVTMGNFIIFFTAILLTFWRWMRPVGIAVSVAMIGFLIVASDGRLAAGTCVMMVALTPLLLRMDQRLGFLIFFGVLLGAWLMVWASGIQSYEDTTLGRVFFTVYSIRNMTAESWLGLDFDMPYKYFDSGIAYFISSQSVVLVLAFLLAYSFAMLMRTIEGQLFKNLLIFAFALSLLVSNGYFSIKTAALWWFVCGCLWQMVPRRAAPDALPPASDTPPRTAVAT
ncbi:MULTISPECIES: polysaccharide biosynthesis protein GumE [Xanthomonas translucens group]|nr:polysaccharide biosynthesis protein GumE [Xanthomonas translucens]KTF30986.1 polysaccharide biosynthesis protein GumE [Xanthomonas translucens pv. translucens]MCS3359357.1 polysaccharide biosynthesis protein GumE [Xanthomonas translucens pv. translucens]MCS3372521.1 polysaccharide biosynthesis protein GumE [Xanthomonas translucens pv. translucens]MCT8273316.1 polysaccharide biosynthesis protein GumE [Xanthomonas translucens pv. translucens]MCT8277540.1 polysaccharide biosynthesis protein Gu